MIRNSPGPWEEHLVRVQRSIIDRHGGPVAYTIGDPDPIVDAANARLIAAAPDLFAALTRLSAAALARDASSGDPIRVMESRAELLEANKVACIAIAKVGGAQ